MFTIKYLIWIILNSAAHLPLVISEYLVAYSQMPESYQLKNVGVVTCYDFYNTQMVVCTMATLPQYFNNVLAIDEDEILSIQACQNNPPWHLSRISQRKQFNTKTPYKYLKKSKGDVDKNVDVYIVDTWIDTKHPEFQGRIKSIFSNQPSKSNNPHGTHVAGLIGSKTYGVNKHANMFAIQALDNSGRTTWSKLIDALSFISKHNPSRKRRAIINISISGTASYVVDVVIKNLLQKQGILTIVAAGNNNAPACNYSPARSKDAITVAATNVNDQLASFSNWGTCVDILAPGSTITSTFPQNKIGAMSGTSMAAPIVAGVLSIIIDHQPNKSPQEHRNMLIRLSTPGIIDDDPKQTNNNLVYQPLGKCPMEEEEQDNQKENWLKSLARDQKPLFFPWLI